MSEDKAKKAENSEAASGAAEETAPKAPRKAADDTPENVPETPPGVDDLMPGLSGEIEAVLASEEAAPDEVAAKGVIARLEAECFDLKDKLLRALAESENIRRRAERDRKDAAAYGGTRLARDLLAVHDNLDRALSHVDDGLREKAKSFIEGVELIQRELLNAFAKHRIEKVSPEIGEKFDPHRHQAMFEASVPGAEPGTVIEVTQAGFTIADRLLRPAQVGVARKLPKDEAKPEADATEPDTAEPEETGPPPGDNAAD